MTQLERFAIMRMGQCGRLSHYHIASLLFFSLVTAVFPRQASGTVLFQQSIQQSPDTANGSNYEKDVRELETGKPIEREMAGDQRHCYKIALEAGQYLRLAIDQKGIDVIVTLFDSAGKKLVEEHSLVGAYRTERVSIIADSSGSYRVEARPAQKDAVAGRYEMKVSEMRMATAQDRSRVMAERADSEGDLLERQGTAESLKGAIEKREEALRLFKTAGDRQGEGSALYRLGSIFYLLGENQKALDYYNQALSIQRETGDRGGEGDILNGIGMVYYALGENRKPLDYFNQALSLKRAVGDRGGVGAILNNLGNIYRALGDNQKALDCFDQRLQLSRALGDRKGEATTLFNLGAAYDDFAEKRKAMDYYNQSLELSRSVGDRRMEAFALNNIGAIYAWLGESQKALDCYNQSLALRQAAGDRRGQAQALSQTGNVYNGLGDGQRSLEYYSRALALAQAIGDRNGEAVVLNNIGSVHESLGDKLKALDYFNKSLQINRARDDRRQEATTLNNIGEIYEELDEKLKALDYYNQALQFSRATGNLGQEASTLNSLGSIHRSLGDEQKAADYYRQALQLSRATDNPNKEAKALLGIARVEAAQGKLIDAGSSVESALNIIESLRTKVASPELRSSYFESAKDYYEFSIDLLMRLHKLRPDEGYDRAALLPFSRAEAEAILSVAPEAEALRALDFNASRATATSAELGQYRIVHFATHGLLNKTHPELSGVVLSLVDRQGKPQDGFLQLHDVYNLDLPAELVVLSACQTGLGKPVWGEGLVGLTRGFMYAGARRVVASLWSVQDVATAELMKRFYEAMLGEKQMRPAEALRAAQIEMWKQRRWRSPYYWGGFALYGEW